MNYRNTKQKELILSLFQKHGHLTTSQIISLMADQEISLATIYRNLNILCKEGKLKIVKINQDDVYELAKKHHYHLQCKCCNDIVDVDEEQIQISMPSSLKENVESIEFVLIGICPTCKEREKRRLENGIKGIKN